MKIYFNAALSVIEEYGEAYRSIVKIVKDLGHEVIDEHVFNYDLKDLVAETEEQRKEYYHKMLARIAKADLMIAEVSFPSTVHVGHELTLALQRGKPVLALYQKGKKPVLFWGLEDDRFFVSEYDPKNMRETIESSIKYLSEQQDTRFNFFISPRIATYLDWIAKHKRIPRAVYLRRLIEEDMEVHTKEE